MSTSELRELAAKLQEITDCFPSESESPFICYERMAKQMQYACEFNSQSMLEVIPDFDLREDARMYIIGAVLKDTHDDSWPFELIEANGLLLAEKAAASQEDSESDNEAVDNDGEEDNGEESDFLPLPPLPHVLQLMTSKEPAAYRAPMIIGLLPVMGTLATGVRFTYNQVETHSLSFLSCIEAPSASGKSFIKRHVDLLLTPIHEQDKIERRKDELYREALRRSRNRQNQPENPKPCIRIQGTFSRSSMLQAMQYAQGKHIFMFFPELSSMVTQRKNGAWSNIDDFLKMSFDNDEYSQAYMTTDSFSGNVRLFFNLLMTGTPRARAEFFKDIESGLIQRTAFAMLPDEFGKSNPIRLPYTESEKKSVIAVAERLERQHGHISCPDLETAIRTWCDEKGAEALATGSRACDMLRKRAAVIGYRAGMLCYLLEGSLTGKVIPFATWVAEYVFRNQMKLFATQIETLFSGQSSKSTGSKMLQELPAIFTKEDVREAYSQMGGNPKNVHKIVYQWTTLSKKVRQLEDGRYEKLAA